MHRILTSMTFIILLLSCGERKVSTKRAILFYDSVNIHINSTRPLIQLFLDKMTNALTIVKKDRQAALNTVELASYLDSARMMNMIRLSRIEKVTEVDHQIKYKSRVLNEGKILRRFLQEESTACIQVFGETGAGRFEKASALLLPRLQELKQALKVVELAKTEFKNKYGFTAISD
jgi:hypothetical protein